MAALTCEETRELFSARLDDALSADERARLDVHLATCAECGREWARFTGTVGMLRAVAPVRAPAGFVDRVLAARPRPWYRRLARGLFTPWPVKLPLEAAAIVLVAGLAILLVQRSPELQHAARAPEPPAGVTLPPSAAPAPGTREPAPVQRPTGRESTPALADESTPPRAEAPAMERRTDSTTKRDRAPVAVPPAAPAEPPRLGEPSRATGAEAPDAGARAEADQERENAAARPSVPAPAPQKSGDLQTLSATGSVLARLRVADRAAAERSAADLVTRAGGQVVSRGEAPDAVVLRLVVPGGRWHEVRRDLEALGVLRLEGDPGGTAGPVRVTLWLEG
jgi:hypothetical protein